MSYHGRGGVFGRSGGKLLLSRGCGSEPWARGPQGEEEAGLENVVFNSKFPRFGWERPQGRVRNHCAMECLPRSGRCPSPSIGGEGVFGKVGSKGWKFIF